jgi:integrase
MNNMDHACTVTNIKRRGEYVWQVRWHEEGRVHRSFFSSKAQADSKAALLNRQAVTSTKQILLQPQEDGQLFLAIQRAAKAQGITLTQVLQGMAAAGQGKPATPTLSAVLAEMEARKLKSGANTYYVTTLRQIINRFAKAQEPGQRDLPIDQYTVHHLEVFLDANKLASRKTLRSKLSTFFKYAVLRDYRVDNPCFKLLKIRRTDPPPKVFTVEQVTTCLKWLEKHPRAVAWFVLTTFCGLRPEEAQQSRWTMINFDEGWIRVEAQTTKTRTRRIVEPRDEAMAWLKYAQEMNSELPLTRKQLQLERIPLRDHLGWEDWPKDITRHTASSMWFAHSKDSKTVAKSLGHSEAVMRKNYMALVTPKEAAKFWALRPPAVKNPYVKPTKKKKPCNSTPTPSTESSKSSCLVTTSTSNICDSTTPTPTTPTPTTPTPPNTDS